MVVDQRNVSKKNVMGAPHYRHRLSGVSAIWNAQRVPDADGGRQKAGDDKQKRDEHAAARDRLEPPRDLIEEGGHQLIRPTL